MKKGTVVKILYPPYVAGLEGVIKTIEDNRPQRWIIEVIKDNKPILLSLKRKDFEVVECDL
jgi:hypothetical protein